MIDVVLFLIVVSALATSAAWLAEAGLRRVGAATRFLWIVAMAAAPVLLVAPLVLPRGFGSASLVPSAVAPLLEVPPLQVMLGGGVLPLDRVLVVLWIVLSSGVLVVLAAGRAKLAGERRAWRREDVLGRSVLVSGDRGPAVAGTLRPWIVLPSWALALPESDLGLVLLHEEEHLRARDSVLLVAALALVVGTPWNPLTWWQLRRLRSAMEMDCDRRVLSRGPDARRYGSSLLSVAGRATGPSFGLAAFAEGPLELERRIIAMTEKPSRWTPLRAAALAALAIVVAAQACAVESPVVSEGDGIADAPASVAPSEGGDASASGSAAGASRVEESETWRTPYTVAPAILNRAEVQEAMVREYPPLLREAGIGGRVTTFLFIDKTGTLTDYRIDESSGHLALDDAALRVAGTFRFSPALNGDEPIDVWISMPITFTVR